MDAVDFVKATALSTRPLAIPGASEHERSAAAVSMAQAAFSPLPRGTSTYGAGERAPATPHNTPSTCAHTATMAKNKLSEASAIASSATARTITLSLNERRT